jgi:hypothetical protein
VSSWLSARIRRTICVATSFCVSFWSKDFAESCRFSHIFSSYDDVDDDYDDEDEDDDDDNMLLPVVSISRCLLITRKTGCYVTNVLIDEDLEVSFFCDHSIALTESLGSNLIQGIGSVTWKALIQTKGCQSVTAVQLARLACPYTVLQLTQ